MERIEADLLIPGSEGPVREGVVLVDSGQISYAGPAATIAMGTDILVSTPGAPASWGTNGAELLHLVELGLSPLEAIQAATAIAPQTSDRRLPGRASSRPAMTPT